LKLIWDSAERRKFLLLLSARTIEAHFHDRRLAKPWSLTEFFQAKEIFDKVWLRAAEASDDVGIVSGNVGGRGKRRGVK